MTSAPANLLAARKLLLAHLDVHAGSTAYSADLDPAEVGIVGDPAHRGGYHCGADRVLSEDYSVVESARDRTGLSDFACALDVGDFSVSVAGKRHTLATFSMWLVAQCKAGAADTRDIREVIYSPDGVVVRRWDRLGKRTSGDSSHRWHTHISYHRDAIKAGRDQSAVMRRYLTYIGLIEAPTVEDDMTPEELRDRDIWPNPYGDKATNPTIALGTAVRNLCRDTDQTLGEVRAVRAGQAAVLAAVQGLDTEAVLAEVRKVGEELPGKILAALPDGSDPVTREELEAALRSVLGSVDNPQS